MSALGCVAFMEQAHLVSLVAVEAIDEPDAVLRHPEVVDMIADLAGQDGLLELFGGDGRDPDAFVSALAEALRPYQQEPLEAPELIQALNVLALALRGKLDVPPEQLLL